MHYKQFSSSWASADFFPGEGKKFSLCCGQNIHFVTKHQKYYFPQNKPKKNIHVLLLPGRGGQETPNALPCGHPCSNSNWVFIRKVLFRSRVALFKPMSLDPSNTNVSFGYICETFHSSSEKFSQDIVIRDNMKKQLQMWQRILWPHPTWITIPYINMAQNKEKHNM